MCSASAQIIQKYYAYTHLPTPIGHTYPSTNPWKARITEKLNAMCCAIFGDIHRSWRPEAEPLLLSHLPREAVNTSWPPPEASSWVWRLPEPRGLPGSYSCYLSLYVQHIQIHKHIKAQTFKSLRTLIALWCMCTHPVNRPSNPECSWVSSNSKSKCSSAFLARDINVSLLPTKTGWRN